VIGQRSQHAHLMGAEDAAAPEDERDFALSLCHLDVRGLPRRAVL
jgi:hypothetical protein